MIIRRADRGFTLVELLVVMAVLGILSAAIWPLAEMTVQRQKERELKRALWEMRDAIDAFKKAADAGRIDGGAHGYPASLDALVRGVPSLTGGKLYFLRRVPSDPFAPAGTPPEQGWGLRSFESPPEKPQAGADVFDVYSRSERVGLNGVALREW